MVLKSADKRLLIYGDSRSLPRGQEGIKVENTWISHLSEKHLVYFRGHGGITSTQIVDLFQMDKSYFHGEQHLLVIFFFGIVDAAPRPITYLLKSFPLQRLWSQIINRLEKFRLQIQQRFSYRVVSPRKFERNVTKLLSICQAYDWPCIVLGNPLPPISLENRSPGFRESTRQYNNILKKCVNEFHRVNFLTLDHFNDADFISVVDGHHLGISGHRRLSNCVLQEIRSF